MFLSGLAGRVTGIPGGLALRFKRNVTNGFLGSLLGILCLTGDPFGFRGSRHGGCLSLPRGLSRVFLGLSGGLARGNTGITRRADRPAGGGPFHDGRVVHPGLGAELLELRLLRFRRCGQSVGKPYVLQAVHLIRFAKIAVRDYSHRRARLPPPET